MEKTLVSYTRPLFAVGRKSGEFWNLLYYFHSEKTARNSLARCVNNYRGCAMEGEFALLSYNAFIGEWQVEGHPIKA